MNKLQQFFEKPYVCGAVAGAISAVVVLILISPTNVHQIISAVAQLLWPIAALVVVFLFSKEVRSLLNRVLSVEFSGVKLQCSEQSPPPSQNQSEERTARRSDMEYKILKTLWTKQINRFPKYEGVWTFRINGEAPEFAEFRVASAKLIGEQLVSETDQGQLYLTQKGFAYCKEHYREFPESVIEWWPEESLDPSKLEAALESTEASESLPILEKPRPA